MKNCFNNVDLSDILNEYLANLKVLNNNLYNLHFNVVGVDSLVYMQNYKNIMKKSHLCTTKLLNVSKC